MVREDKIIPPFSSDEMEGFMNYQNNKYVHPYTCGTDGCSGELLINEDHMFCPRCNYTQKWFHQGTLGMGDYNPFNII